MLLILFVFVLISTSCKKDINVTYEISEQANLSTCLAGFGDRSGTPTGRAFHLPYRVYVTSQMLGYDPEINYCNKYVGVGNIFAIFTLENQNPTPITFTFPAGLIFLPDNDSSQTGLTIRDATIAMEAHGKEKVLLKFFCINHNKHANYVNYYTMSVISDNDQVNKLINAVSVKSDSTLQWHTIQLAQIVWNISDYSGLTQADLDSIKKW